MEFELEIRLDEALPPDVRDEYLALKELPDFDELSFLEENTTFRYVPLTFDMRDIGPYNYYDDTHTIIRTPTSMFIAKIPYRTFQGIREAMLGIDTKRLSDFTPLKTKVR